MMLRLPRGVIVILALLALGLFVAWMAGLLSPRIAPGVKPLPAAEPGETYTAAAVVVPRVEPVPASIEARDTTLVASRLLAQVTSIAVRPGDMVTEGDTLATLEQRDLQARLGQATENMRSVAARRDEAQLALTRAEDLLARQLVAQSVFDEAAANMATLSAQMAAAEQAISEAEAALDYAMIRAPISGRIIDRLVDPGDTVSPGTPIVSLYNPNTLRVEAWVREGLAVRLEPRQTLTMEVPSLGTRLEAQIEEIVPAADPGSRAFMVRLMLPARGGLVPGMYARVDVPAGEMATVQVPERFIREVGQLNVLWVVAGDRVERRFVRVGRHFGALVEIIAGLESGETVTLPRS